MRSTDCSTLLPTSSVVSLFNVGHSYGSEIASLNDFKCISLMSNKTNRFMFSDVSVSGLLRKFVWGC